ncbi:hypothetical protein [Allosphingosinicella sp.]|uniref:hypothetical protein n=1 Tax=Allosphingosinicella sp. TaxID=2823234 RepID=UPI002FC0E32E
MINLYACGRAEDILDALPHRIFVPQIAAGELGKGTEEARHELAFLQGLISGARLDILELSEAGFDMYARLVAGPRSLGDGEAATLAIALDQRLLPVIDERKARSRLTEIAPSASAATTVDLLLHDHVQNEMGRDACADAVWSALQGANMSVRLEQRDSILALIGHERATKCRSLPGYKRMCQAIESARRQGAAS